MLVDEFMTWLLGWITIWDEPGFGEVLPYAEGEVADVKWFGVYLVRDIARYLAAWLRGACDPFVGRN
jgi:hypothetical protein